MRRILYDTDKQEIAEELIKLDYRNSPAILCTAKGETISVNDSIDYKTKNIKLYGNGKQRQYEGKNLFDISHYTSIDGVLAFDMSNFISENTHTFSAKKPIRYKISDSPFGVGIADCVDYVTTHTTTPNYSGTKYIFFCTEEGWVSDVSVLQDYEIQFELGEVATPFEPFVGNEPSPNMNYPQKAEFLGESGSIKGKVLTKNLWNKEYASDGNNWNVADEKNNYYSALPIYVGKGNTVTLNCQQIIPSGVQDIFTCITLENKYAGVYQHWFYHANNSEYQNKPVTVTATDDYIYIWCLKDGINNGNFMSYMGNDLQLVYGNTKTDYEPYTEQPFTFQTPNGLRGIPLGQTIPDAIQNSPIHMNGVYWDNAEGQYYIGDTKNENGKDVQRIGKYIATGSNNIGLYPTYQGFSVKDVLPFTDSRRDGFCNQSVVIPNSADNSVQDNGMWLGVGNNFVYVIKNSFYDENLDDCGLANFKAHLNENPLEIYTWLDEPIVTETDTQLDVVMNYPNTTIVNDEGAYMEVEYVADTKCYIDNKFKELEANITSAVAQLL